MVFIVIPARSLALAFGRFAPTVFHFAADTIVYAQNILLVKSLRK